MDPLAFFGDEGMITPPAIEAPAPVAAPVDNLPAVIETPAADNAAVVEQNDPRAPARAAIPDGYVPLPALQEVRGKVKSLEQELAEFRAARSPSAAPQPQAPAPVQQQVIPAYGTPEYGAYIQDEMFKQQVSAKLDKSEMRAIMKHGEEAVTKVQDWAATKTPEWFLGVLKADDPYKAAMDQYNQEQRANLIGNDDDAKLFAEWKAARTADPAAQPAPVAVAPSVFAAQQAAQQKPLTQAVKPSSIANVATAGDLKPGDIPVGAGAAFDQVFK